MVIADHPALKVQESNAAAQALLARPGARLNGSSVQALVRSSDQPALLSAMAEARGGGQHPPLRANLAHNDTAVMLSLVLLRQQQDSLWLLRLSPVVPLQGAARRLTAEQLGQDHWLRAFAQYSTEALVFTDLQGRILQANPAFAAQAQLASAEVARGEMLDRWLGGTGVELPVLITNLRQRGAVALFATRLRAEGGAVLEVELSATVLPVALGVEPGPSRVSSRSKAQTQRQPKGQASGKLVGHTPGQASELLVFVLRDAGRRAAAAVAGADNPSLAPTAGELGELVGRMPMKEIVSETSDMIEKLCIETALQMTSDNRALAAQLLGISRQSLYVKLRRYDLGELGSED
jgi:PAS domain S-box-containing protein